MNRVLIVEDHDAMRRGLVLAVGQLGCAVSEAATVAEALARLDGHDAVILDLNLRDGHGTEVLRRIREENRPIKVAVWTGTGDGALLDEVAHAGPDAVFIKPGQLDKLLEWTRESCRAA